MKSRILDAIDRHIAENACPVCQKLDCKLGVKHCAEKHGGRKALKDLIRRLDEEREEAGLEATPALRKLYDCYKAVSPHVTLDGGSSSWAVAEGR